MIGRCWLLLCFFLALTSRFHAYAQEDGRGYFTAEVGSPLIGEPIDLLFAINVPDGSTVTLPEFPRDWPPFMIRDMSGVDVTMSGGRMIYRQYLTVILWRPGDYQTPETVIEYQLLNSLDKRRIVVQPAYFTVKTVLNPDDLNLRPLKIPVSMFYVSPLTVGTALVGLGVVSSFLWSRRRKIRIAKIDAEASGLHASARLALDEFKRLNGANVAPPKVYALVSDVLRRYVQGRFDIQAEEMTTGELVESLHDCRELSERRQHELAYLLEQADLVKFARMQPPSKSADKMLNVAQRWVVTVEQEYLEARE